MAPSRGGRPESDEVPVEDGENSSSKAATQVTKKPPPESAEFARTRRYVVLAFWIIVLCFGVPFWWTTTTVYRASLPLQAMESWARGEACQAVFPLPISVYTPDLQPAEAQKLVSATQHALDDLNDFSAHHLRLSTFVPSVVTDAAGSHAKDRKSPLNHVDEDAILTVHVTQRPNLQEPTSSLEPHAPILNIGQPATMAPNKDTLFSALASSIASRLGEVFAEEQATLRHLMLTNSGVISSVGGNLPKSTEMQAELQARSDSRTMRSMKYAPVYHITFSLLTPEGSPSDWDIEEALDHSLRPLLKPLSTLSNFTIDTQVQPYASFSPSVQPVEDSVRNVWVLQRSDLAGFVNAAEWPLSPSIDDGPTINFILYVPSLSQSPLLVNESSSNSWLVPQWGGISIHNPLESSHIRETGRLTAQDLEEPLIVFSAHLLSLLGLPSAPPSLPLRISTQTRILSLRLLHSASSTLGSLTRLTQQLTSISIPKSVAASVDATLIHLDRACAAVRKGEFQVALDNARTAESEIEKAFFDKRMVGQVYFPEEHKVAVYLPLLGPVAIPLILNGIKELRIFLQGRR
ncbi:MAG: GPI transamidase component [Chrysothrix sp. TS-e1954]|nr:MAG: GPI transamidase component [Chrysothrix sp. TS-e1954]